MSLSPGTKLAIYEILRPVGAGGMGEVYRARDSRLGRDVAIKVLPKELSRDETRLTRFEREARLLASLNHPNIATIHSFEESDGIRFLVMELVEGETLSERIGKGPIPWREARALFSQIAGALDAAHEKGVVHRDLKPANVMINARGDAKILDFGLAKVTTAVTPDALQSQSPTITREGTEAGLLVGTAPYMSPEQARGRSVDERADIWAFGCCLYEALTGRATFLGETVADTFAKILERAPEWSLLPADTPESMRQLLRRCLEKDASARPQSIGADLAMDAVVPKPGTPAPSIAVLPFVNLSSDPDNEYFADGITEDVIAQLSKIRALKVISRTSVMSFKKREQSLGEIANRLGVATVLEGSVRRAGTRVRIVAQLIDAEADQHLWAETYDRELTDIFAIQSDVALNIATALEAEISPEEKTRIARQPTKNLEAYQLYLKGHHCLLRYTDEGIRTGLEYFRRAIALDPSYALGYVGIAWVYLIQGMGFGSGGMKPREAYSEAEVAVRKALELDGELGDAHGILATLQFVADFDWVSSERTFARCFELSCKSINYDAYGLLLGSLGRFDEAIAAQRHAKELDPLMPIHSSDLATTFLRAGRYDDALDEARRVVNLEPNFHVGHAVLGWAHMKKGMRDEGIAEIEKAVSLTPYNTAMLAQLGQAYAMAHRADDARAVLRRLEALSRERYVPPYHMAYIHTGLGEPDKAIDALELAYEERAGSVYGVKGSFLFTDLHGHPRFEALLEKMNLAG